MNGYSKNAEQVIEIVSEWLKLKSEGYKRSEVYERFDCSRSDFYKYIKIYEAGGFGEIKRKFKPKLKQNEDNAGNSNSRASLWSPEFKHSGLWNVALFGKENLSL